MTSSSVWKQEPSSPLPLFEPDSWFSASDNVAVEVEITDEIKTSRSEHASKLLEDLDQWAKEEDPFPDWLEEKIDLPIFDDLPPPPPLDAMTGMKPTPPSVSSSLEMLGLKPLPVNNCGFNMVLSKPSMVNNVRMESIGMKAQPQTVIPHTPLHYQIAPVPPAIPMQQTPELMQELDYGLTNPTTHDTLTPPESPREAELVFTMLQGMQSHELDELVRMRVESLVESPDCGDSSRSSLHEESESVASPSSDSGYSDPEWTLPANSDLKVIKKRRTTKPYSRTPPEEKKMRKKEQNKNAATRYRMKKKQEVEDILGEEKQLQDKNEKLSSDLVELRREIKYLKSLMRDIFKAKGLIK